MCRVELTDKKRLPYRIILVAVFFMTVNQMVSAIVEKIAENICVFTGKFITLHSV